MVDHPKVVELGLFFIADEFQKKGGSVLIIDDIHKIKNFEIDLKLIYNSFFVLQVIFTGSNAAAIDNAKADLSRRALIYKLPVLSFREYLELEMRIELDALPLSDILTNHTTLATKILTDIKPFVYFEEYLKSGAYPFYKSGKKSYVQKLLSASMQILETDLPITYTIVHISFYSSTRFTPSLPLF